MSFYARQFRVHFAGSKPIINYGVILQSSTAGIFVVQLRWNATLLTSLMEYFEESGQKEKYELVKRLSPIAWVHINFLGRYSFMGNDIIDIDKVLSQYKAYDIFNMDKKKC